jgi:hypothetical protein
MLTMVESVSFKSLTAQDSAITPINRATSWSVLRLDKKVLAASNNSVMGKPPLPFSKV